MPAIMDDPSAPTIHRVSGETPYPDPNKPVLPENVRPRQVTLRDRQTIATVVPFVSREQVPPSLLRYLSDQFGKEIEGGDTYPMIDPMPFEKFSAYWLQNFAGIMLLGQIDSPDEVVEGKDWSQECLGSFYIKPNYPGRSSHVCNAGFLVTDAARNRGVGRLMGETYLDWAPKLGYTYSVFNLVYETNVASCRIWDALGFKRIGRVKNCGNLKSYPDRLVDAIIYGRDLGTDAGEGGDPLLVSEERFDKIKFYLKYGRYPNGSDRAEKSRLRSAATHYKLLDNDVLMLKGKEVISDPVRQMAVARRFHEEGGHAGINKTTSVIAESHHWSRIKETVSDVIRTCDQCKDGGKSPSVQSQSQSQSQNQTPSQDQNPNRYQTATPTPSQDLDIVSRQFYEVNELRPADLMAPQLLPVSESHGIDAASSMLDLQHHSTVEAPHHHGLTSHLIATPSPYAHPSDISAILNPAFEASASPHLILHGTTHHASAAATLASLHDTSSMYHPIDPQIISQPLHSPAPPQHFHRVAQRHADHGHPVSPHISHASVSPQDLEYSPHTSHPALPSHALRGVSGHDPSRDHEDTNSFQALLTDPEADASLAAASHGSHHEQVSLLTPHHLHHHHHHHHHYGTIDHDHNTNLHSAPAPGDDHDHDHDQEAVDRDMAMLIDHHDDDDSPSPSPEPRLTPPSPLRCEMDVDGEDDRGRGGTDAKTGATGGKGEE
ncbi:hypothetical protein F4808DRAFT_78628 [Astrocystis sublimbata]|nr:hypothetical protein F4808DRAFT_78628 [Astrocystis sublimbata]